MPTILVVDDDVDVADVLRLGLEQHGFAVVVTHDGTSALDLMAAQRFALVILDVRMPGLNGFAVLQGMRARNARPRILVLSGDGSAAEQQRARVAGADSYHLKPFRVLEVVQQVQSLLHLAC
ncbi:MAG: response regulator [Ktedonobacterales bacterium]|nr:response regulator [Ktedonobacterales bacterium]